MLIAAGADVSVVHRKSPEPWEGTWETAKGVRRVAHIESIAELRNIATRSMREMRAKRAIRFSELPPREIADYTSVEFFLPLSRGGGRILIYYTQLYDSCGDEVAVAIDAVLKRADDTASWLRSEKECESMGDLISAFPWPEM